MKQNTLLNFPAKVYSWSKEIDTVCIDVSFIEKLNEEKRNGTNKIKS
jgi:hypothetical protein